MKIFLRKTLLAFTSFAAAFIFTSNMNAVTVTDIDGLKALYNSAAAQNIELGNGIYSTGTRIGPAGAGLKTIDLKNFTLSFYNNSASVNGGVMDLSNASLVLTNGNVIFSSNTSSDYGGAVYAYGSEFTFSGENITFSGNTAATLGGAIFAQSSVFIFNGNSSFVNNTAADFGAAILAQSSSFTFTADIVNFSNNSTDKCGGAIFAQDSYMAFDVRNIMFAGNKTLDDGGAIYVFTPSTFTFNAENINFSANASNASGGAIAAHSSEFTFSADNINFSGNTAANGSGGAIHANSSVFTFDGANINFSGNTANEKGGAIYNAGVLNLASAGSIIFAGNTAGGVDNDIYNAIGSTINITGSGNVIIGGGINGEGIINKTGEGTLCLGGKNDIGELNATNGVIKIESGSKYTGGILKAQGAAINMQNGTDEEIKLTGLFISETNLKIDVMADGKNDKVTASSATVGGNLDIKTMVGDYTSGVEYEILSATGGVYGVFASSGIMNAEKLNYEIKYLSDKIILSVTGLYKSEFETMLGLTYNQSETARVFDTISENAGAFAAIITEMEEKRTSADEQDRKDVLSFLAHTSGYFIANVIRNAAADSPSDEIYDKIKNHKGEKTNNGVWLQAKGGEEIFKEDAQSPENYKDKSIGVMAGIDRYDEDKNIMYGAYARLNQDNIEQGKNKADAVKSGIGIYGGYIKESWEIKAMALGSYDKFETQRAVMGEKAKGNIEAITINADIEGALNIWATENIKIRPYGAIEAANANYGEIKEKEGGIYNLKIKSGNYVRTSARIGAGAQYIKGIWLGYAEIEGKYLISGERPEIESVFEARSEEFKSRGTEEGKAMIGAGLGGEAQAGKNWTIFANVKIYAGEKYESITANAGVRYVFGR